jgi:hypothetical protein
MMRKLNDAKPSLKSENPPGTGVIDIVLIYDPNPEREDEDDFVGFVVHGGYHGNDFMKGMSFPAAPMRGAMVWPLKNISVWVEATGRPVDPTTIYNRDSVANFLFHLGRPLDKPVYFFSAFCQYNPEGVDSPLLLNTLNAVKAFFNGKVVSTKYGKTMTLRVREHKYTFAVNDVARHETFLRVSGLIKPDDQATA